MVFSGGLVLESIGLVSFKLLFVLDYWTSTGGRFFLFKRLIKRVLKIVFFQLLPGSWCLWLRLSFEVLNNIILTTGFFQPVAGSWCWWLFSLLKLKCYLKRTENMFLPAFGRILTNSWFSCVFGLKLFYQYSFLRNMYYLDVFFLLPCFPEPYNS